MRSIQMALWSVTTCYHVPPLEPPPKVSGYNANPHPKILDGPPYIEGSSDPQRKESLVDRIFA